MLTYFSEAKKSHEDYASSPCTGKKVLVIGGGPGGLRSAIEAALLGAEVMLIEQRPNFTRNNVSIASFISQIIISNTH